ncbi:metal ABC transporter permease [Novipirellula artificiosorum]|uniref:Manganese transport system membrane protein MntB n=1 Tax=Novipirellula artificiosorum TaxID=2528016 RepID=A0A5C6DXW3_9BACT|nr:iron chelate uptake ABC transporter family permease subunit [Novipirellula artificiosorum]TWU39669.1 Manganese transport system membrane protein MntB [Novipirellula artificiosorum]
MIRRRSFRHLAVGSVLGILLPCVLATSLFAADGIPNRSLNDQAFHWPLWDQWADLFLLRDYNTKVVVIATTLLGCAAGVVGTFTLLRKRALMGDALSHATLPGIAIAFMIATTMGGNGKSLPLLLLGASVSGMLGVAVILLLRNFTRLKEDTALGAVLSVFFGAGMALLGIVTQMQGGNAAGLEAFIYGKTASMGFDQAVLISLVALICTTASALLFKEFKLLCFDEGFAGSRGFPVILLDLALMALVVLVCIVGLQAVGLILMIALLVIPAASARFWTDRMQWIVMISAALGAMGGMLGAGISAVFSKLPSGATIVLVCGVFFAFSLVFGVRRGLLVRLLRRRRMNNTVNRHHLLRALYELSEPQKAPSANAFIAFSDLLTRRSWSPTKLNRSIRRSEKAGLVERAKHDVLRLTDKGFAEATRLTREHRLWEIYLITYADIAASKVDRDADAIEHVLEPEIVEELETLLQKSQARVPDSPHSLEPAVSKER